MSEHRGVFPKPNIRRTIRVIKKILTKPWLPAHHLRKVDATGCHRDIDVGFESFDSECCVPCYLYEVVKKFEHLPSSRFQCVPPVCDSEHEGFVTAANNVLEAALTRLR